MKRINFDISKVADRSGAYDSTKDIPNEEDIGNISYAPNYRSVSLVDESKKIDLLRARAEMLTGKDRILMEMYFNNGSTFRQMARLADVNEATIARHINKIIQRLLDSEYITFIRNRDKFTPLQQAIARDYFLGSLSQRSIAKKQKTTLYQVQKTLKQIQVLVTLKTRSA